METKCNYFKDNRYAIQQQIFVVFLFRVMFPRTKLTQKGDKKGDTTSIRSYKHLSECYIENLFYAREDIIKAIPNRKLDNTVNDLSNNEIINKFHSRKLKTVCMKSQIYAT